MHHDFLKPATFSDSMNQSVIAKFKVTRLELCIFLFWLKSSFRKVFSQESLSSVYLLTLCLQGQLFKLMNKLEDTTPHFIRCIKPNSNQLPGLYEENHVLQQLRCCGVLEIVRISRSGYPTRLTHQELAVRFGLSTLSMCFVDRSIVPNSHAFLCFCRCWLFHGVDMDAYCWTQESPRIHLAHQKLF